MARSLTGVGGEDPPGLNEGNKGDLKTIKTWEDGLPHGWTQLLSNDMGICVLRSVLPSCRTFSFAQKPFHQNPNDDPQTFISRALPSGVPRHSQLIINFNLWA